MSDLGAQRDNPYVGLRPFFFEDSGYFFGRDQQTAQLLETLHKERFLAVVGSSGCGKSSLVRAGLIPMLLGGFLTQERLQWAIARMKPGDAPAANLASALADVQKEGATQDDAAAIEEVIREEHAAGVASLLERYLGTDKNVLILVDQFEEIFAFRKSGGDDNTVLGKAKWKERARRRAEAAEFVDLLLRLSERRDLPIYIVLTMRTDFLGDCDVFYGLPEAMNRGRYLVPRLTRQQLREAIHGPVLLKREKIAPRLLDRLLNELGDRSDRLPVLQHALLRTWDTWSADGGVGPLDIVHFDKAGGLDGALSQDAKGALEGLDRALTERIFKCLTDTDTNERRVRRPARISELMAVCETDRAEVERIVTRFNEDNRNFLFTSPDGNPDDPRVDMAHESLIRQWDDLRGWVDEERMSRDQFLELVERGRGARALLQDPDLQVALDWFELSKPTRDWARRYERQEDDFDVALAYLNESKEEAEAEAKRERELAEKEKRLALEERERLKKESERRRKRAVLSGLLAVVFGAIAIAALVLSWRLNEAREEIVAGQVSLSTSENLLSAWADAEKSDREFMDLYGDIPDSIDVKRSSVWLQRMSLLQGWHGLVDSVATFETLEVSVPEKISQWQRLLSDRTPRTGPDTDRIIATAARKVDSLQQILDDSFAIWEGSLIASAPVRNSCPGRAPSENNVVAGEDICVWFEANVGGRGSGRVVWSQPGGADLTRTFTGLVGRSYSYGPGLIRASLSAGETEVRVLNERGNIVFRQVVSVAPGS